MSGSFDEQKLCIEGAPGPAFGTWESKNTEFRIHPVRDLVAEYRAADPWNLRGRIAGPANFSGVSSFLSKEKDSCD
jgi:hypothetical protein